MSHRLAAALFALAAVTPFACSGEVGPLPSFEPGPGGGAEPPPVDAGGRTEPTEPNGPALDAGSTAPTDAGPTDAGPAADGGARPDAGPAADAGSPPLGLVPVVVAQGVMGRTLVSCDDGQSWRFDRSFDREAVDSAGNATLANEMVCGSLMQVRCESTSCQLKSAGAGCSTAAPCDCLHHPGYAKGVSVARGQILAAFGWGYPGVVLRSSDGKAFTAVRHFDGSALFPGLEYGAGRYVHFSGQPMISDDGTSWRPGGFAGFNGPGQGWTSPRAFAFLDYGPTGRFIGALDGNQLRVSADRGDSWSSPASVPAGCTDGIGTSQQILTGNGIAVIVTSTGKACRSVDGGATWSLHSIAPGTLNSWSVFARGQFLAFSGGTRWSSADGATWVSAAMSGPAPGGAVGASPSGTLVGVNSTWDGYATQRFVRSTDLGLSWSTVAAPTGHPIHRFAAGLIERSPAACP